MGLNKIQERNLAERIKQITKENRITMTSIKREIEILKRAFETNKDRLELMRKQKQSIHDENLRRLIELNKSKMDMAIMNVYNTSKNLSAFYNLAAIKTPVQPQQKTQQPQNNNLLLVKRSPSRLSARNRYLINTKARICHSSYSKTTSPSIKIDRSTASSGVSTQNQHLSFTRYLPTSVLDYHGDDDAHSVDGLFDDIESLYDEKLNDNIRSKANSKKNEIKKENKISFVPIRQSASAPVNSKRNIKSFELV